MNEKIKLKAQYLHPSENLNRHPQLKRFKDRIQFSNTFGNGAYCLYGQIENQQKLLYISNNDGLFTQILAKQNILNSLENIDRLSLTQYSALLSIISQKEGTFDQLENPMAIEHKVLEELTNQTFGWLLWSWQITGLVSYYIPTVDSNKFINHLHIESNNSWSLLGETKTNSGQTLYKLIEQHSLGRYYNSPPYYFGDQLKQLIHH